MGRLTSPLITADPPPVIAGTTSASKSTCTSEPEAGRGADGEEAQVQEEPVGRQSVLQGLRWDV